MIGKRLLALLAATGVIGLSPVYAEEDSDNLSLSSEMYTEQIAALDDESSDFSQMAALDEPSDEGVAGRAGFDDGSEGLAGVSSIEGSDGHWAVQTPSSGGLISD